MDEQTIEKLDRGDVYILDLDRDDCDNDECPRLVEKIIKVDLREIGQSVTIGRYCGVCAEKLAARVRGALPADNGRGDS